MSHRVGLFLLPVACLCGGCDDNTSRHSLVGSWDIPSDKVLAGETIRLWFRKYGDGSIHRTLSYTLSPDGTLVVEEGRDRSVCCFGGIDRRVTDRKRRFRLSAKAQSDIRRMLARLRPKMLAQEGPFSLPEGCGYVFDGSAWSGVGFERGPLYGGFLFQSGCDGDGADKAKRLLSSIIAALPPIDGSADFLR